MDSSRGFAIASLSSGFRIALVTLRLQFAPAPCFAQPIWDGANIVQVRVGPTVLDADRALLIAFGDPRGNLAGPAKGDSGSPVMACGPGGVASNPRLHNSFDRLALV